MYAIFRYGESAEGKWITFDAMDNDVSMKKTQETIESDKLELLLSDLEKSLNEEYGGMM